MVAVLLILDALRDFAVEIPEQVFDGLRAAVDSVLLEELVERFCVQESFFVLVESLEQRVRFELADLADGLPVLLNDELLVRYLDEKLAQVVLCLP